jgi:cob(I)alamin adenosyltransferase
MGKLRKGYIQIYTGNGKGKTTAAVGLGVRAAGNGFKVYMVQFLKSFSTGELSSIEKLHPHFQIFRFEKRRGFFWNLSEAEKGELKTEIHKGYCFAVEALKEESCDILILDEIMGAISNGLLTEEQVLELMNAKPEGIEIIMTGRNVPDSLIERADLVTEMKDVKHYFNSGVPAREGIEY